MFPVLRLPAILLGLWIAASPQCFGGTDPDSLYREGARILAKPRLAVADLQLLNKIIGTVKLSQVDTALRWAVLLQEQAAQARQPQLQIAGLYHEAAIGILHNQYLLAAKRYGDGAAMAKRLGLDSLQAQGDAGVGSALWQSGRIEEALDIQFRALRLRQKIGDRAGEASSLVNLGRLYYSMQRIPEAEKHLDRGLAILESEESPESRPYLNALHAKANIAGQAGRFTEALRLDSIGLAICARDGNIVQQSMFLDNIANCYGAQGRWSEAEQYFRQCLVIDSATGNPKDMGDTWLNLGSLSEAQGKNEEAVTRYRKALEYAVAGSDPSGANKILMQLAPLYRTLGQTDSAFSAMTQAYALRDSVLGEGSRAKLDELNTLYETELKERRISQQAFELSKRNYLLAGAAAILLFTAIGGWSYIRRQRLRERLQSQKVLAQQREEATRAIIVAEEEERSRLGRELHDGVGQVISAAKMHLTGLQAQVPDGAATERINTAIDLVDSAAGEIRALAHGMAPEPLLGAGLARAAQDMLRKMQTGMVSMDFHSDELPALPTDTTVVLYRILQEAAQNAMKHGSAKHIAVTLSRTASHLTLLIEDDGTGFNAAAASGGIGLANMRKRTEYLHGELEIDSAPGRGTTLAVHVPI